MGPPTKTYKPALGHHWLTRFYDPLVRLTTREGTFKLALLKQAGIQEGQQILDLGCGTGTLAIMVKRAHPKVKVAGLDADPEVLNIARTKLEAALIEAQLDQGLASALPYASGSFDRILSSLLFHHLSTDVKQQAMHEAFRVLRPSGNCILQTGANPQILR